MLGAEDATDAVRLELELNLCFHGLGSCHAAMFAPEGPLRVGSAPELDPDS